jgi:methylated-DNA-[protein]-cysteine S-methyltransferase
MLQVMQIYEDIASPVGRLRLISSGEHLTAIWFEHGRDARKGDSGLRAGSSEVIAAAKQQLHEYFCGSRCQFDLPLAPRGTDFQQRVWAQLMLIEYGTTTTYGALANQLGNPNASRAVGLANGSNPIPIVIPCHRVIGASGALTGFGGGLPVKSALLQLERSRTQPGLF